MARQSKKKDEEETPSCGPISIKVPDMRTRTAVLKRVEDISELTGKTKYATWIQKALYGSIPPESKEARILESTLIIASEGLERTTGMNGIRYGLHEFFLQRLSHEELENDQYAFIMLDYVIYIASQKGLTLFQSSRPYDSYLKEDLDTALEELIKHWEKDRLKIPEGARNIIGGKSSDPLPFLVFLRDSWEATSYRGKWSILPHVIYFLDNWEESAYDREEFFERLEKASNCMKAWEKDIAFYREHGFFPRKSNCIRMGEKAQLIYPSTWTVLNPEESAIKKHPISIYVGTEYSDVAGPRGIFFSEMGARRTTEDETERAMALLMMAYPYLPSGEIHFKDIEVYPYSKDTRNAYITPIKKEDWKEVLAKHSKWPF